MGKETDKCGMAGKSKKKPALGEEKGIFRQRKRHIWVLYLSVKKKKELNINKNKKANKITTLN